MAKDKPLGGKPKPIRNPFAAHPKKAEALADLMKGDPVEDVAKRYKINERTVFRYYQFIKSQEALGSRLNQPKTEVPNKPSETFDLSRNTATDKEKDDAGIVEQNITAEDKKPMTDSKKTTPDNPENPQKPNDPDNPSPNGGNLPSTSAITIFREGGIPVQMIIPPFIFTMFDLGKQAKVIPEDADFDLWVVECVTKRFELDYKLVLGLNTIEPQEQEK